MQNALKAKGFRRFMRCLGAWILRGDPQIPFPCAWIHDCIASKTVEKGRFYPPPLAGEQTAKRPVRQT